MINLVSGLSTLLKKSPVAEEDWPWVWAIEDPLHLDWKKDYVNDRQQIQEIAKSQFDMPVQMSSFGSVTIYMSDAKSAHDMEKLKEKGITHVLNMAGPGAQGPLEAYENAGIVVKTIRAVDDFGYAVLSKHLDDAIDFIEHAPGSTQEKSMNRHVVVHCTAGLNRSGAIVAAYTMLTANISVLEAVAQCRLRRGIYVLSNQSFVEELVALARKHNLLGPKPGDPECRVTSPAPCLTKSQRRAARQMRSAVF